MVKTASYTLVRLVKTVALAVVVILAAGLVTLVAAPSASATTPTGVISIDPCLNFHSTPAGGSGNMIGCIPNGVTISISCTTTGTSVTGPWGATNLWDYTTYGGQSGYVADAYVYTKTNAAVAGSCGSAPAGHTGQVAASPCLNFHSGASGSSSQIGCIPYGATITIDCTVNGTSVTGPWGTLSTWDHTSYGGQSGYVADAWVHTGTNAPVAGTCGAPTTATTCAGPTDTGKYNGKAACLWATKNWNAASRFKDDCTWFVSQALWEGGLPNSTTSAWTSASWNPFILAVQKKGSSFGPFAYPGPTVTAATAAKLVSYLVAHGMATKKYIPWSDNTAGGAKIGDLIAYYWDKGQADGTIDHVAMVTGFSGSYPLVSQHTPGQLNRGWSWSNTKNQWIQYSSDIPNPKAYLIHVTG